MLGEALEIDLVERKPMRRDEQKTQLIVVLLIVLNFMFFRKKIPRAMLTILKYSWSSQLGSSP